MKLLSGFRDGKKVPCGIGHFFIAVDIEQFIELQQFKKLTGDILRELRGSKKMPGEEKIYTPGEKEYYHFLERKENGTPVTKTTQDEILTILKERNMNNYKFEF